MQNVLITKNFANLILVVLKDGGDQNDFEIMRIKIK